MDGMTGFSTFFRFKSLKTLVGFRQKLKPLLQRVGQKKMKIKQSSENLTLFII